MNKQRRIVLGIVGDSAAGKTTLTRGLTRLLGPDHVTHICADDYHKYDRVERAHLQITPLNPECNYLDILERHLERTQNGEPILKPVYDHSNGTLVRPQYVQPREFVIVEGLLGFHTAAMRAHYDVKVYLDPPEDMRRVWKIRRDTANRGYRPEQVLAELERRESDSAAFIRPQREHADIVVRFYPGACTESDVPESHLNVRLVLRPTIPHPDLSYLIDQGRKPGAAIRLLLARDCGRPVDFLEIDGTVTRERAAEMEDSIWKHVPELRALSADQFGDYSDAGLVRHSDPLALTQLLITYHLLRAHRSEARSPFVSSAANPAVALEERHGNAMKAGREN